MVKLTGVLKTERGESTFILVSNFRHVLYNVREVRRAVCDVLWVGVSPRDTQHGVFLIWPQLPLLDPVFAAKIKFRLSRVAIRASSRSM